MATLNAQNSVGVITPGRSRGLRGWRLVALSGVLLLALLGIGYVLMMQRMQDANTPPPGLDTSWTQISAKGLYRSTVAPSSEPIAINQLHSWRLHVETADGQPVDDATITIHGDMPGHGHGLPTEPAVTQKLGNGDYLVEGLKFQMGGWWYVDMDIVSAKGTDTVRFNFVLK